MPLVPDGALGDLDVASRVRHHHLHDSVAGRPEVAGLGVQRAILDGVPGALGVEQPRLADVDEGDLLDVGERFDRRVVAGAAATPRSEQERQRRQCRVRLGAGRRSPRAAYNRRES